MIIAEVLFQFTRHGVSFHRETIIKSGPSILTLGTESLINKLEALLCITEHMPDIIWNVLECLLKPGCVVLLFKSHFSDVFDAAN